MVVVGQFFLCVLGGCSVSSYRSDIRPHVAKYAEVADQFRHVLEELFSDQEIRWERFIGLDRELVKLRAELREIRFHVNSTGAGRSREHQEFSASFTGAIDGMLRWIEAEKGRMKPYLQVAQEAVRAQGLREEAKQVVLRGGGTSESIGVASVLAQTANQLEAELQTASQGLHGKMTREEVQNYVAIAQGSASKHNMFSWRTEALLKMTVPVILAPELSVSD